MNGGGDCRTAPTTLGLLIVLDEDQITSSPQMWLSVGRALLPAVQSADFMYNEKNGCTISKLTVSVWISHNIETP